MSEDRAGSRRVARQNGSSRDGKKDILPLEKAFRRNGWIRRRARERESNPLDWARVGGRHLVLSESVSFREGRWKRDLGWFNAAGIPHPREHGLVTTGVQMSVVRG